MANMKNYVSFKGNLGAKPERFEKNGQGYTRFNLGVNNYKKNRETGEYEKLATDWISVTAFSNPNKLAERVATLDKGDSVHVQGKLSTGSFDKDGITIYTQNVIAEDVVKYAPLQSEGMSKVTNKFNEAVEAIGDI